MSPGVSVITFVNTGTPMHILIMDFFMYPTFVSQLNFCCVAHFNVNDTIERSDVQFIKKIHSKF